jgi:hypothetical protein
MSLAVPGEVPFAPKLEDLPAPVQDEIKQGVFKFESKFASWGMLPFAQSKGWIDEFREQLVSVAVLMGRSAK